jgi:DNA-binding NarL/FixJ family response regulator
MAELERLLSPQEREVVTRLARGDPQKAIAIDLDISDSAVKTYVRRAKLKLSARSVIHLAVIVTVNGDGPSRQNGEQA